MSMNIMGFDSQAVDTNPGFELGQINSQDSDASSWMYVLAGSGGLTSNYAVSVDENGTGLMTTTTVSTYAMPVGVPAVTITAGSYGWIQIAGNTTVQVSALCAADVRLNTTATPGQLDDDATGGSKSITSGMKLNTAAVGAGLVSCFLNNPNIAATL